MQAAALELSSRCLHETEVLLHDWIMQESAPNSPQVHRQKQKTAKRKTSGMPAHAPPSALHTSSLSL